MSLISFAKSLLPTGPSSDDVDGTQFGAIPYRIVEDQVVFLMITSRRSANWVFPKGSPIKGLSPTETAAQEVWEEAGVRGEIDETAIGHYLHPRNKDASSLQKVKLFPMLVTEQLDDWPEEAERFRHWALLPQTRRLLASRHAARLAVDLSRRLMRDNQLPGSNRISA